MKNLEFKLIYEFNKKNLNKQIKIISKINNELLYDCKKNLNNSDISWLFLIKFGLKKKDLTFF